MPHSGPYASDSIDTSAENTLTQGAEPKTSVFKGPLGLRAGWGIALYLVLGFLIGALLFEGLFTATGQMRRLQGERQQAHQAKNAAKAAHQPTPVPPLTITDAGLAELSETGAVLLAAVVLARVEKRRFGVYGLALRSIRNLLPGALFGLLAISLLIGCLAGFHLLVFDRRLLYGTAPLRYGAAWLLVFLLVGCFEEFLFRGYIQFTLFRAFLRPGARLSPKHARRTAFWIAALIWSLAFGATHLANAGEDPVGILSVFGAGVVFAYALWRTGSLWWGIGFHMTWDWGQSFLYGVPDSGHLSAGRLFATHTAGSLLLSGGSAGPEGSLLILPVFLLIALVIRLHPQATQPPVEPILLPHSRGTAVAATIP